MTVHLAVAAVVCFSIMVLLCFCAIDYDGAYPPQIERRRAQLRGALRSKTIWFNALVLAFVGQLPELVDYMAQNMPGLQPYLPASHANTIIGAITIANVILRFRTTHPLERK